MQQMSMFHASVSSSLLLALLFNSLLCLGVHVTTREGMVFEKVANMIRNFTSGIMDYSELICKPLFNCLPCMGSFWGIIGYLIWSPDINIILYCFILCGVNSITSKIYYYGND